MGIKQKDLKLPNKLFIVVNLKFFNSKKCVVILFLIGIILISISTFNFAYKIPELDETIGVKEKAIRSFENSHNLYQIMKIGETNTLNQLRLLSEINPNSTEMKKMYDDLISYKRFALIYLYQFSKGKVAEENITEEWKKMDFNQLGKEEEKYVNTSYLENQVNSRNELIKNKQSILFQSIIFQIVGLLINQFATILEITRKKD